MKGGGRSLTKTKFLATKLSCRFRTRDNQCMFHESAPGDCKIDLCPLVEKFGGIKRGDL